MERLLIPGTGLAAFEVLGCKTEIDMVFQKLNDPVLRFRSNLQLIRVESKKW